MPLATPSNIAVSRLYRVFGPNVTVDTSSGKQTFPPERFDVYGNVSWTNTESSAHAVVLTISDREILLPQGATLASGVYLTTYIVPETAAKNVTIAVKLRQGNETAEASSSVSVNGGATAAFGTSLSISAPNIVLPPWTGAVSAIAPPGEAVLTFSLANADVTSRVPFAQATAPLGGLIQGQTYRARYQAVPGVAVTSDVYYVTVITPKPVPVRPLPIIRFGVGGVLPGYNQDDAAYEAAMAEYNRNPTQAVRQPRTIQSYNPFGNLTTELFFVAPAPVIVFSAQNDTVRAVRNTRLRRRLVANYRATWAISSGNPGGFGIEYVPVSFGTAVGPDEAYLVGTPLVSGSFTIGLTATRADVSQTSTATVNLTVVDSLPRTVVTTNSAIAREGVVTSTADVVNIAFQSTPSPATWAATGLPPGVSINGDGTISGRPTRLGVFFASLTAQADEFDVSLPTTIKFTVGQGDGTIVTNAAALRAPWLLAQWELTDIHISARSREVDSTMMEAGALRLKIGDAADFAIFFIDTNDAVFALAPSELRMTIRKEDNLDERIVYKSVAPPPAATQEGQTYYLISVATGNRERETVLEWAEENGNNAPLRCVADVDWVTNGKRYSSRSFPVLLELDVTRP